MSKSASNQYEKDMIIILVMVETSANSSKL